MSRFGARRIMRRAQRQAKRASEQAQGSSEPESSQPDTTETEVSPREARPNRRSQEAQSDESSDRERDTEEFLEQELASYQEEVKRRGGLGALLGGWRLFPRAARYARPYRGQAASTVFLTVILALLALAEPWPLAFVVDSVLGDKAAPKWVTDLFGSSTGKLILVAVIGTLLISLVGGVVTIINEYIQTKLAGRMNLDFRSDLFSHMQRLSFTYHENTRTGLMMYRMTGTGGAIELMVDFPNFGQSIITMVGMAWIAYRLDPVLAQLAMIVVPLMYFSTTYYAARIEPAVVRVRAMEGMSLAIAHEALAMIRVITSFGRERHEFDRFRKQGEQAVDARVRLTVRQTVFNLAVSFITALGTATVLGVGAYQVLRGNLSVGQLLVIMSYIALVYTPLESLAGFLTRSQQAFIIFQYALDMLDTQPDIIEKPDATEIDRAKGEIVFENVAFGYDETRPDVLKNVSFRVEAGHAIAIVGPTGAGKSTLLSLLPRFYDPAAGRVLVDGYDVRDLTLDSIRAQYSIVLQEPLLFTGTIRDNIRYGRLDATDEEVREAARAANAHDFIMSLPDRYKTHLGERGTKISGGERQRIAIARAFLRDAPILILDEPTSSIDSKTEGVILDALDRLMTGRTTIMIAHRLSTIRHVDRILVLDGGEIVEHGTHDDLLEHRGLYRQLWDAQARERRPKLKASGPMTLEWRAPADDAAAESSNGRRQSRRAARREARRQARRDAQRQARRQARKAEATDGSPMISWKPGSSGAGRVAGTAAGAGNGSRAVESPADQALSIMRDTDRIVVLSNGAAVQHGTHDELIAQEGPYRQTWEAHIRRALEAVNAEREALGEEHDPDASEPRRTKFAVAAAAADDARLLPGVGDPTSGDGSARSRLSEIRSNDRVLVMDRAEVVQYGTHAELIAQPGPYRDLWEGPERRPVDSQRPMGPV